MNREANRSFRPGVATTFTTRTGRRTGELPLHLHVTTSDRRDTRA